MKTPANVNFKNPCSNYEDPKNGDNKINLNKHSFTLLIPKAFRFDHYECFPPQIHLIPNPAHRSQEGATLSGANFSEMSFFCFFTVITFQNKNVHFKRSLKMLVINLKC